MKTFALIGAAGYISPRHMQAIKETGNELIAAYDKFDSVGILDSYFPDASFFTEFERFDRHLEKLRIEGKNVDYVSICSPNYLHDAHIRFALRIGAHAICEKPIVLNPWNAELLSSLEKESDHKIFNILQLRLHPSVIELKKKVEKQANRHWDIDLQYITSRGKWYHHSWKGDVSKSGGIATNIGIHFFDMLIWIFGDYKNLSLEVYNNETASGILELENATVKWFLSIDSNNLPDIAVKEGKRTFRSITIDDSQFEFSQGFTELHNLSYQKILDGDGFRISDALPSLRIVHQIRNAANSLK